MFCIWGIMLMFFVHDFIYIHIWPNLHALCRSGTNTISYLMGFKDRLQIIWIHIRNISVTATGQHILMLNHYTEPNISVLYFVSYWGLRLRHPLEGLLY